MNKFADRLKNGRTSEQVTEDWTTFLALVRKLPETKTFAEIMEVVCQGARMLCGAQGVTFVRRDGELCHYVDEDAISPLWKGQRFPMTACISGWCMIHGETAVVPDIYADTRIPHEAYRPTFVKTLIMVPVQPKDPIAAIGAYWAEQTTPASHTIMMMEALARSTETAIRRAEMLEAAGAA